jgi:hypothetical protein
MVGMVPPSWALLLRIPPPIQTQLTHAVRSTRRRGFALEHGCSESGFWSEHASKEGGAPVPAVSCGLTKFAEKADVES